MSTPIVTVDQVTVSSTYPLLNNRFLLLPPTHPQHPRQAHQIPDSSHEELLNELLFVYRTLAQKNAEVKRQCHECKRLSGEGHRARMRILELEHKAQTEYQQRPMDSTNNNDPTVVVKVIDPDCRGELLKRRTAPNLSLHIQWLSYLDATTIDLREHTHRGTSGFTIEKLH